MKNKFVFINNEINYHSSWREFILQNLTLLNKISLKIGNDFTPETEKIFLFLKNNLIKIRCVILGQDPYPNKGDATGRAFEVGGYESWLSPIRNTSLNNIFKLVINGNDGKENILSVGEIRKNIIKNELKILSPNKLFKYWQGRELYL